MKNNSHSPPMIGITMGDPAGIGPEIIVRVFQRPELHRICRPVILGDPVIMEKAIHLLDCPISIHVIHDPEKGCFDGRVLNLMGVTSLAPDDVTPGIAGPETGAAMLAYIHKGIDLALSRNIDALVTGPITKSALKLAGSKFHGHTEILAHRTGTDRYAMMLAGSRLRVVPVTIHIPISSVSSALSLEAVRQTIQLTHAALKGRFSLESPRIAVAGLNPHSGEDGMFGDEEKKIIRPAVMAARADGISATGPLPPDTVFHQALQGQFDAVVCMYHDQGLIPFKLIHFRDGVNTTLGLPIIRTSVDHGTAYDIAWKGIADPGSLLEAVRMAAFQAGACLRTGC